MDADVKDRLHTEFGHSQSSSCKPVPSWQHLCEVTQETAAIPSHCLPFPPLFPRCRKSLSFIGPPLVCGCLFMLGMIWFAGSPLAAPSLAEHSADFQSFSPWCHLLFQTTTTKFHAVFCSPPSWFHAQMCLCLLCSAPWSCIF